MQFPSRSINADKLLGSSFKWKKTLLLHLLLFNKVLCKEKIMFLLRKCLYKIGSPQNKVSIMNGIGILYMAYFNRYFNWGSYITYIFFPVHRVTSDFSTASLCKCNLILTVFNLECVLCVITHWFSKSRTLKNRVRFFHALIFQNHALYFRQCVFNITRIKRYDSDIWQYWISLEKFGRYLFKFHHVLSFHLS